MMIRFHTFIDSWDIDDNDMREVGGWDGARAGSFPDISFVCHRLSRRMRASRVVSPLWWMGHRSDCKSLLLFCVVVIALHLLQKLVFCFGARSDIGDNDTLVSLLSWTRGISQDNPNLMAPCVTRISVKITQGFLLRRGCDWVKRV